MPAAPTTPLVERARAGALHGVGTTTTRLVRRPTELVPPRDRAWTLLHLASLGLAAVVLLAANRNQWFWGDEWAFVADRSPGIADLDLFRPHNDHWSTIPLLIYWALLSTVGLTSYLPYVAVVVVLHLGLAHLLWRACVRCGARPALTTGLVAVFAVLGAGSENLLWAFQVGFVGAVTFGWMAVLLHDHDGPFDRRDLAGWAASIAALLCAGPALVMVGVATLTVGLRRRRARDAVLTAAGPGLVFTIWWLFEGRHADRVSGSSGGGPWDVLVWTWTGLTHALGASVGATWAGGALLLALGFWWVRHRDLTSGRTALAAAAAVGALAFYFVTATGRSALGPESATASRYIYVGVALLLPAGALALSRAIPSSTPWTAVVLGLCLVLVLYNVAVLRREAREEAGREQALQGTVVATARLLRDPDHVAWNAPDPVYNPNLAPQDLVHIDRQGWLPEVTPDRRHQLTAEALTEVAFVPAAPGSPLGTVSLTTAGDVELTAAPARGSAACVVVLPSSTRRQVTLASDQTPWRARLSGPEGSELPVEAEVVDGGHRSAPLIFTLPPEGRDLVSGATGRAVRLTLPSQEPVTLCGVEPGDPADQPRNVAG